MKPNKKKLAIDEYSYGAVIAYEELYDKFDYDDFCSRYEGEFRNDEDFVISVLQDIHSWLSVYIDWDKLISDTMADYDSENGFYFRQ